MRSILGTGVIGQGHDRIEKPTAPSSNETNKPVGVRITTIPTYKPKEVPKPKPADAGAVSD